MTSSLHKRMTLGVIGFAAALLLSLIFLEDFFIQRIAEYYVSTRLEHDSETLIAALRSSPNNQHYQLEKSRIDHIYQRPFSGHYFKIALPDRTLRSRSLWDEPLSIPLAQPHYPALLTWQGPQQQLLVYINQYEIAGELITIATAESLAQLQPLIRQAQLWSAGAVSLLIFIFVCLQYRWVTVSLSPLQTLQQQLKELRHGKRQQLEIQQAFAELDPLINELNQLIIALDDRIARSRNAMGNLAHALKTPLTTLQQLCDSRSTQDAQLVQKMHHQLKLIRGRIDNELKRARIAGDQGRRSQLNISTEIIDLTNTLKKIYADKHIDIQCQITPEYYIVCDRQDFLELAGNLLDNAFKWANKCIHVSAQATSEFILVIEDDGVACDHAALNLLTQRGKRLDEKKPGHGLGLSIVQDIVAQYKGTLRFAKSSLGGLFVEVSIPQQASNILDKTPEKD